jgi:hypothetical protein
MEKAEKPIEIKMKSDNNTEFTDTVENVQRDFGLSNKVKQAVSTAPTYIPKNFNEQIVFYKNGTTFRIYLYIGNAWCYGNLTAI